MRSSLSTAGRRASVLAAAALVSLTTAACGPADLQVGAAGAAGQTSASSRTAVDRPQSLGDATTAPSSAVPTPAVPAPTTPAQPQQPQAPVAEATESQVEAVEEPESAVPAEAVPGAPQAAAPADPGRWTRDSPSGRSTSASAPAPAPAAAAAAPAAAGTSTGGSGGAFTDQARRSFTAGNGQSGNYLLYAGGVDPT